MKQLIRVKSVTPLDGHKVFIKFEDNTEKEIDLNKYLHGPIFESIRNDEKIFQAMNTEDGTIAWENGADIDPDVLYYGLHLLGWKSHSRQNRKAIQQLIVM